MHLVDPSHYVGGAAELLVAYRFLEAGRLVAWPLVTCRYDLIVDTGDARVRVQVKSARRPADAKGYYVHLAKSGKRTPTPTDFDILVIVCEPNEHFVIPVQALLAEPDRTALVKSVCVYLDGERFGAYRNRFGLGDGRTPVMPLVNPTTKLTRTHWFTQAQAHRGSKRYRRLTTADVKAIQALPIAFFKRDEQPGTIPIAQVAQQFGVCVPTLRNLLRGKRQDLQHVIHGQPTG